MYELVSVGVAFESDNQPPDFATDHLEFPDTDVATTPLAAALLHSPLT